LSRTVVMVAVETPASAAAMLASRVMAGLRG
jgi:hypothetical protein